MPMWIKLQEYQVVEWRDGHVFQTQLGPCKWFEVSKQPSLYRPNAEGYAWASCGGDSIVISKTNPNED